MANDSFIGIDVKGIEELKAKFAKLGPEGQGLVVDDVSLFLINLFKQYPPEKRVSRKAAYGVSFFNKHGDNRQQKKFFAMLKSGEITVPYKRTQGFRKGWKQVGKGKDSLIVNETEYGKFLMGDGEQSRHALMIGWNSMEKTIEDHKEKMLEKADGAIKKAIKKVGLGT